MARRASRAGVDLMTWAKFCDTILDHPKCIEAGEDATSLFIRSVVWCCKHLTDGRIPRAAVRTITARADADDLAARLVAVGLWEDRDGAWWVHDFLDYNPSRAEVDGKRADLTAKRSAAGRAGNLARWGRGGAASQTDRKPIANGSQPASQMDRNGVASGIANASPRPVPSRPKEEEEMSATGATGRDRSGADAPLSLLPDDPPPRDDVADVFAHWQRATGKGRAVLDAKRRTLIARALKLRPAVDLCRAVDGYASSPWHRGENDRRTEYLSIDLMLRDAAKIEQGIDLAVKAAPSVPAAPKPIPPPAKLPPMPPDVLTPEQLRAHNAPFLEELRRKRAEREAAERKRLNFGREVES